MIRRKEWDRVFVNAQGEQATARQLSARRQKARRVEFLYFSLVPDEKGVLRGKVTRHALECPGGISIAYHEPDRVHLIFNHYPVAQHEYDRIPEGSYDQRTFRKDCLVSENFFQFIIPARQLQVVEW